MNEEVDYLVVGAGPAGLYSAWRIAADDPRARVLVIERRESPGGRVRTVEVGALDFIAEVGAMRFKKSHRLVWSLVRSADLKLFDFRFPATLYSLRGRLLLPVLEENAGQQFMQYKPGGVLPSKVEPQDAYVLDGQSSEIGKGPDELLMNALRIAMSNIEVPRKNVEEDKVVQQRFDVTWETLDTKLKRLRIAPELLSFNYFLPAEWQLIKRYGRLWNQNLFEIGLLDIVNEVLSSEAAALARDGLGYQSILDNWNAAEMIPWFLDDFASGGYHSLLGGMRKLIDNLVQRCKSVGVEIRYGVGLTSLDIQDGNSHSIIAKVTTSPSPPSGPLATQAHSVEGRITAQKAILAIPADSLRKLHLEPRAKAACIPNAASNALADAWSARYNCVQGNTLLKAFLLYDRPWFFDDLRVADREALKKQHWRCEFLEGRLVGARMLTDMPIRQIYFHGPGSNWWRSASGGGAIMIYCDSREAGYFRELANRRGSAAYKGHGEKAEATFNEGMRGSSRFIEQYGVSTRFVDSVTKYLGKLFERILEPGRVIPKPTTAFFQDWSLESEGGSGWYAWKVGIDACQVRPTLACLIPQHPVFVVGDSFSDQPGWIEGALKSAERVLHEELGLDKPKFFSTPNGLEEWDYEDYLGIFLKKSHA